MAQSPDARRSISPRQAIRIVAAAVVILAAITVVLIAAGAFDPQPLGSLIQTDKLDRQSLNETGERNSAIPAPWFAEETPDSFSVRLVAAYIDGELDSGYGLAVGDDSGRLVVALSPLGYAAIWRDRPRRNHLSPAVADLAPYPNGRGRKRNLARCGA